MRPNRLLNGTALVVVVMVGSLCSAENWPSYLHDSTRSGITAEQLSFPLHENWRRQSGQAPKPAWPAPAPHDYWHNHHNLRPTVTYDRAYHVTVAGQTAYYASSADDKVYAVETATGKVRWSFFTEGPVRLAPTVADGKVFAGSDDGSLYCLKASDGALLWQFKTHEDNRRLPGNGRIISYWPIRCGIVVENDTVYFGAGLFPNEGMSLFALNAQDGTVRWKEAIEISGQGYMLASSQSLYVPTGRTNPVRFAQKDGKRQADYSSGGGAYALLTSDILVSGPGRGDKTIVASNLKTRETLASFNGLRMLVNGSVAYLQSETKLSAFNRVRYLELSQRRNKVTAERERLVKQFRSSQKDAAKEEAFKSKLQALKVRTEELSAQMSQCYFWTVDCDARYSLILAGETLIAGGHNNVVAIELSAGREIWRARVTGAAYGLSAADGRLFVSTDRGVIHCFSKIDNGKTTALDPTPESNPYPKDRLTAWYAGIADKVVQRTQADKGYCLVLGSERGRLAFELAKRTQMQIICVEEDSHKVAASRRALDAAGLYGSRITVHHGSLETLPYPSYFANLIVSEKTLLTGELTTAALEVYRLLRPYGGCLYLGQEMQPGANALALTKRSRTSWLAGLGPIASASPERDNDRDASWIFHRRGALQGVGEWTQLYCDASHTACSEDHIQGPLTLQWFGAPGPQQIVDRHHRPMSPLAKDGRVFIPADNRIITADMYNGTRLWELEVPRSRRIGAMKDAGQMLLTDDLIYIASGSECWGIDVATGQRKVTFPAPHPAGGSPDWGYLNRVGNRLIGSAQKKHASFFIQDFNNGSKHNGSHVLEGDFREVVVSDYLFSFDRHTQDRSWTYRNGSIMNSAIAVGEKRIYFAESRNPDIINDSDGRVRIDKFCATDLFIVALDLETGEKLWEQPFSLPFEHIMFINFADNTVLLTGTYNVKDFVHYGLFALHGDSGQEKWRTDYLGMNINGDKPFGTGGSHGEQWQHPVINGTTVYSKPYAYDLHTGEKKEYIFYRGGHGCGGFTGSVNYMYGRGSNPRRYPLKTQTTSGQPLTQVTRPGCWLNIIPAGGLILLPESSSGCTCAYSVQTSLAFAPQQYYAPPLVLTPAREFQDAIQIELADRNGIGAIRYTLDGSEPNEKSPLYAGPIALKQTTTLKAKTYWAATQSSPVAQANFVRRP